MTELRHQGSAAAVSPAGPEKVLAALGELEVAHEELRVAEEQLAEQRQEIKRLVAEHDRRRRWRDHLFSLLPVGVLVTDREGKVLEANACAAALLGVRPVHLAGKPLLVYVATTHRRLVRDLLAQLLRGEPELRATVTLTPRDGPPLTADLIALPDPAAAPGSLRWVILPESGPAEGTPSSAPVPPGEPDQDDEPLRMATALAQLCALPADASDQQRLLGRLAAVVGSAVPGTTAVSITIGDPLAPDQLASDSAEAQAFDGLQLRLAEGPCVDAFHQDVAVVAPDITRDARWPRLARSARAQALRAVLALPIRVAEERTGVLNLYATRPRAFTEHTVRVGEAVAAAVAAVQRDVSERSALQSLVHHLERALTSRAAIEQAKGIVMAHHGGTPDEAFARLVAFSSHRNVKLRDLAEQIVREGGTTPLGSV